MELLYFSPAKHDIALSEVAINVDSLVIASLDVIGMVSLVLTLTDVGVFSPRLCTVQICHTSSPVNCHYSVDAEMNENINCTLYNLHPEIHYWSQTQGFQLVIPQNHKILIL